MTVSARREVQIAASSLLVDATAAEVVAALNANEIGSILLKGPSVVRALYPHAGARGYSDVDLLIDPARLEQAERVLSAHGFHPAFAPRLAIEENHARPWARTDSPVVVDVHRTLPWLRVDAAEAWRVLSAHTEPLELAGVEMRVLARPALALHLALHAASHGPTVEEPLRDLELAIERWDLDVWRSARDVADELDALAGLRAGLMLVSNGALADQLDLPRELPLDLALTTRGPTGAVALHGLLRAKRWRERLSLVRRQVFPPPSYMRAWSRHARNGTLGLLLAYAQRWFVVARRLPRAATAVAAISAERTDGRPRPRVRSAQILAVSGLERRFGDRAVVRNLDLTLEPGERVAFWGPNGSGKTTVIRCIAGSLAPTSGAVTVAGHPSGSMAARRLLGLSLAQERSFYMRLSGRANLLFFARLRYENDREAARAVAALGDELELDEILATRADACSAGMLQQLAFARALLGDPALMLLDEPTRSLDAAAVERLWAALERRERAAVVVASHNLDDTRRCGSRIDFPT